MLRDNLVGLIEPMLSSAGAYPLALCTARKKPSDDRPPCLENPRPEGAESTLTENAASPFHAEPKHFLMSEPLTRRASLKRVDARLDDWCQVLTKLVFYISRIKEGRIRGDKERNSE